MFEKWKSLVGKYTDNEDLMASSFKEIKKQYRSTTRFYHGLEHVGGLIELYEKCGIKAEDEDALLLTLWLHDAVYDTYKKDNEEKSAEFAVKILSKFGVPSERIQLVCDMIKRTANHIQVKEEDLHDVKLLFDLDLSILGQDRDTYITYMHNVRKEYRWVPEFLYKRNRKKVLNKFVELDRIYHNDYFKKKFERRAKSNMKYEIKLL